MLHRRLNGADLHAPTNYQVENNTGALIPALTAVSFDGIGTNFPDISPANGFVSFRGVTMTDIADGTTGYITSLGFLIDVDTSAWTVGTSLFADAFGTLTTTPTGPLVATVYKQDALNGQLYIETAASSGGGGTGDVVSAGPSTDNAIARFDGITGKVIQNSATKLQDSGAIEAQGFITRRAVTGIVTVSNGQSWIAPGLEIESGGAIVIDPDGELIIV